MGVLGVLDWLGHFPTPRCWKLGQLKQAVVMWLHQHVKNTFTTKYSMHHSGYIRVYLLGTFQCIHCQDCVKFKYIKFLCTAFCSRLLAVGMNGLW